MANNGTQTLILQNFKQWSSWLLPVFANRSPFQKVITPYLAPPPSSSKMKVYSMMANSSSEV